MAFAALDVSSVAQSLHRWEIGEYVSEAFVIIGCAGELIADLATCISRRKRRHIERWSTIVLVLALTIGLKCLIRTNELSGIVIGSLGEKSEEADTKAKSAISNSSIALSQSKDALDKAGRAQEKGNQATTSASKSLVLAKNVRHEADQLRADLDKANKGAADLQTKLELIDKQTWPRRILDPQKFVASLRAAPKKAHVRILFTPTDSESWEFAWDVWALLGPAGKWGAPGAGWDVDKPEPIPSDGGDPQSPYDTAPLPEKWGAWPAHGNLAYRSGVGFLITDKDLTEKYRRFAAVLSEPRDTALEILVDAFSNEHFSPAIHTNWQYPPVPEGTIILVIGQIR